MKRLICNICNKKFYGAGLLGHLRFKHGLFPEEARKIMTSLEKGDVREGTDSPCQAQGANEKNSLSLAQGADEKGLPSQAQSANEKGLPSQAQSAKTDPEVHTVPPPVTRRAAVSPKPPTYLPMEKKEASGDKNDVSFSFLPLDWGSESFSSDSSPLTFLMVALGVLALGWVVLGRILKPEVTEKVGSVLTSFADKFGVKAKA